MRRFKVLPVMFCAAMISCSGWGTNPAGRIVLGIQTTGLGEGKSLTLLQHQSNDTVTVTANGDYQFPPSYGTYRVSIIRQPLGQSCTVANETGTLQYDNTPPVLVTCANTAITIGGTISGLLAGETALLRNTGVDSVVVSANGGFTFPTPVASGTNYYVTVDHPFRCTKSNEYGVATAPVTTVRIIC